jgi:hypothetical protein
MLVAEDLDATVLYLNNRNLVDRSTLNLEVYIGTRYPPHVSAGGSDEKL